MLAFHNDVEIKDRYLERLKNRQEHPQLCKLYVDYEYLLGIPKELGELHDMLLENLSSELRKNFSKNFISVIPVGADICNIIYNLARWLITDKTYGYLDHQLDDDIADKVCNNITDHARLILIKDAIDRYKIKTFNAALEHAKPFSGNTLATENFALHNTELANNRIWTAISHQLLSLLENAYVSNTMQPSSNPAEHLTPLLRW